MKPILNNQGDSTSKKIQISSQVKNTNDVINTCDITPNDDQGNLPVDGISSCPPAPQSLSSNMAPLSVTSDSGSKISSAQTFSFAVASQNSKSNRVYTNKKSVKKQVSPMDISPKEISSKEKIPRKRSPKEKCSKEKSMKKINVKEKIPTIITANENSSTKIFVNEKSSTKIIVMERNPPKLSVKDKSPTKISPNLSVSSALEWSIDLSEDCNSADTSTIDMSFDMDMDSTIKTFSSKRPNSSSKSPTKKVKSIFDIPESPEKKKLPAKSEGTIKSSTVKSIPKILKAVTAPNSINFPPFAPKINLQKTNTGSVAPIVLTKVNSPPKLFGNLLPINVRNQAPSKESLTPVWTLTSALGSLSSTPAPLSSSATLHKVIVQPVKNLNPVSTNEPAPGLNFNQVASRQRKSSSAHDVINLTLPSSTSSSPLTTMAGVGRSPQTVVKAGNLPQTVGNFTAPSTVSSVANYSSSKALKKVPNNSFTATVAETQPFPIDVFSNLAIPEQNVPPKHSSLNSEQNNDLETSQTDFKIEQKWLSGSRKGKKAATLYSQMPTSTTEVVSFSQIIDSILQKTKEDEERCQSANANKEQENNATSFGQKNNKNNSASNSANRQSALNTSDESCNTTDQQVDKSPDQPCGSKGGSTLSKLPTFISSIVTRKSARLSSTDSFSQEQPIIQQRILPSTSQHTGEIFFRLAYS